MILISLPDCKNFHPLLTTSKKYEILGEIGNAYIIQPDSGNDRIIILKSRFK